MLFVILLSGCAEVKTLPPLDREKAIEESAVFIIPADAKVKRIDGAKRGLFRSWWVGYWSSGFAGSKAASLLLPAGEHTITYEYSNKLGGWSVKNLESITVMGAGKMYMLSVMLDENTKVGTFSSAINVAISTVRDQIIDLFPFTNWLPQAKLEGVVYQINEIDQMAFDQYLLEEGSYKKKAIGIYLLGYLVGLLWWFLIISVGLSALGYFIFMGKLDNSHPVVAFILAIGLVVAGIIIINYNLSGILSLHLLSTLFLGIGISRWAGYNYNRSGIDKLEKKDYLGAISDFNKAIKSAPYNATFKKNLAAAEVQAANAKTGV